MSQNKTVIPGLEQSAGAYQSNGVSNGMPYGAQMSLQQQNVYQRSQQSSQRATRVPGMEQQPEAFWEMGGANTGETYQSQAKRMNSEKPVLGFLYSISRTPVGEFWPLYQGPNTIGQSEDSNIQLLEGTVSFNHAILNVRMMKNPERMMAFITDTTSTNGTMVNGESLGSTPKDCKNGDIIIIGDHYELYLVLLDPATLGLKVSKEFIPVEVGNSPISNGFVSYDGQQHTQDYNYDPYSRMGAGYVPGNGTVGFDGTTGNGNRGGTVGY